MTKDEKKILLKVIKPSKISLICCTLLCLGPVITLINDLIEKNTNRLGLDFILSIITMTFLVFFWRNYKIALAKYNEAKFIFEDENLIK